MPRANASAARLTKIAIAEPALRASLAELASQWNQALGKHDEATWIMPSCQAGRDAECYAKSMHKLSQHAPQWRTVVERINVAIGAPRVQLADLGRPDNIISAALDAGAVLARNAVDNEADLPSLLHEAFAANPPESGRLWLIDDRLFPLQTNRGPRVVHGATLLLDLDGLDDFDSSGDLIFVWEGASRVTIVHHEGVVFHIRPKSS